MSNLRTKTWQAGSREWTLVELDNERCNIESYNHIFKCKEVEKYKIHDGYVCRMFDIWTDGTHKYDYICMLEGLSVVGAPRLLAQEGRKLFDTLSDTLSLPINN